MTGMITSERELIELIEQARSCHSVALDTEFIWERTYYPQLGLIQLALSEDACYLIDSLAIGNLSPLGLLLADQNVVKILHDAPQDLAILARVTGSVPSHIFDTRVAAGFAGLPSTISLSELIRLLLDIELEKSQTRTDWLQRPLQPKQIAYALDDVRYLGAVRVVLLSRIVAPEIRSWLRDELESLHRPSLPAVSEDRLRFRRVKGAVMLNSRELAVLRELAAWREQEARQLDRPRGHILTDQQLLDLSRESYLSLDELRATAPLSAKKLQRYGQAIIDRICTGTNVPPNDTPRMERPARLNKREKATYERLVEFIRLKCDLQGIDPQLVGSTGDLRKLVKNFGSSDGSLPVRLTEGWRKTFLDEFFRQRR